MKYLLLLLLGWAMIGRGMWYCKKSKPKLKKSFHSSIFTFSKEEYRSVFLQVVKQCQYEKLVAEYLELNALEKKLTPRDRIKIKFNTFLEPDCKNPHKIIQTHQRRALSITGIVLCAKDCRVHLRQDNYSKDIKVSLTVCATDQLCNEYVMLRGAIKQIDHQLFVVPPQVDHTLISCEIVHPINQKVTLEKMDFETFMKKFEKEPEIPVSDSSDSSSLDFLSGDEKEEQEL